jgi:hypothetical protein
VPQPGTEGNTYDSQWPPLPTVTVMPTSSANLPAVGHLQQAYGRPPTFQAQGAAGAIAAVSGTAAGQETIPSSSGRSSIDRNG